MSEVANPGAVFKFMDPSTAQNTSDVLGLWTALPVAPKEISFEAGGPPVDNDPIWQINLPADLGQARATMASGLAQLSMAQKAVPDASQRLESLLTKLNNSTEISFDTSAALSQPEQDLMALLNPVDSSGGLESFGIGDWFHKGWDKLTEKFQPVIDQLIKTVANFAWVETKINNQLLARTSVSWTGAFDTTWQVGLPRQYVELHKQSLVLALASRNTLLWVFSVVARAAAKLALLPTNPAGFVMSLPAAWKFVNQVIDEFKARQQPA